MAEPTSWAPGARIDERYRIVKYLGGGTFGEVYAVEDELLRRQRAVKVLRRSGRSSPLERLRAEAWARGKAGNHPAIIDIFDIKALPGGQPYMVMELLEGQDLEQRLASAGGKLTGDEALEVMLVAVDAMRAAHANGVVHLDLKPSNLFLTRFNQTKVLDFGVAAAVGAPIDGGTPGYMPPEQLAMVQGQRDERAKPTADVYSLGATLHALLTGAPPQPPRAAAPATLAAGLPEALRAVLARALAFEPGSRHPDAGALLQALQAAAPGLKGVRALTLSADRVPRPDDAAFSHEGSTSRTERTVEPLAFAVAQGTRGLEHARQVAVEVRSRFTRGIAEVLRALRAIEGFDELLAQYDDLPPSTQADHELRELRAFALNRRGRHAEAEAVLRALLEDELTGERAGLLGRVLKDQYTRCLLAGELVAAGEFLRRAIHVYAVGFRVDPEDPYCGVNALTLMELLDRRPAERAALLVEVMVAASARVQAPAPAYWDLASLLELEVLGERPSAAREALRRCLAAPRSEVWATLSTARNLGLIARAWEASGREAGWVEPLVQQLVAATGP